MRIIRAGEHIQHIPGYGISVRESGVAGGAALHIEDSFTAANGTHIGGRTPDVANTPGNTWVEALRQWTIISNCARGTDYDRSILTIETGAADGIITMPFQRGGNYNGILFRYVDNDNWWLFGNSSGGGYSGIYEMTAGVGALRVRLIDTGTTTLDGTVTLSGSSIVCVWSGHTLSYTSAVRQTATKHGILRVDWEDNGVASFWKMVSA